MIVSGKSTDTELDFWHFYIVTLNPMEKIINYKLLHQRIWPFLRKNLWRIALLYHLLRFYFCTGSNMRWKLNYFKRSSLNQASVLVRTHCSRLFTRDHDVTLVREYSVTSNLFTPLHRLASRFDCSCNSLFNRYRTFSMVSKASF